MSAAGKKMTGPSEERIYRSAEEAEGLLLRILYESGADPRIVALCDSLGWEAIRSHKGPVAALIGDLAAGRLSKTPRKEERSSGKMKPEPPPDETLVRTALAGEALAIDCGPMGDPLPENVRALVTDVVRALYGFRAQAALDRAAPLLRQTDPVNALKRLARIREILELPLPATLGGKEAKADGACDAVRANEATAHQSPWPALNGLLGPLKAGQLVLLVGRPGSGKRAFMLQWIAAHFLGNAQTPPAPCILVGAAKEAQEVRLRAAAYTLRLPMSKVRKATLKPEEKTALGGIVQTLEKSPWRIIDEREPDLAAAFDEAGAYVAKGQPPPLVCIDYLQLLELPHGAEMRHTGAAAERVFAYIRERAREIGSPVMLAVQLNDHPELRHRPARLPDLREQAIGAEAHSDTIVCFPQPPDDPSALKQEFPLSVPHNRLGGTGTVRLNRCLRTGVLEEAALSQECLSNIIR